MTNGKVVHFDTNRGFGFLAPEDGGEDVFLHVNDFDFDESALRPGVAVTFDVAAGDKGKKAMNVAVVGGAPERRPREPREQRAERRDNRPDRGDRPQRNDRPDRKSERPDRSDRPQRGPRGDSGALGMQAFLDELTELLLDSSDTLTAGQIIDIRQRVADFAFERGWVSE